MPLRPLLAAMAALLAPTAQAHGDYEPCHLLCSLQTGRTSDRSSEGEPTAGTWSARLETIYIAPRGHYEDDRYVPIATGSHVTVIELLPSLSYAPNADWVLSAGLPYEYNRADGVVLPTLHEEDGVTTEAASGGLWVEAWRRFAGQGTGPTPWLGGGYRLSNPKGTVDVGDDLDANPDKAIEGLGIGSDDLFVDAAVELHGVTGEGSRLWIGTEYRAHILPRWKTLFATTTSYDVAMETPLATDWGWTARLSGFRTAIRSPRIVQASLLIPALGVTHKVSSAWSVDASMSTQAPGTAPLNRNALRTVNGHFGIEYGF